MSNDCQDIIIENIEIVHREGYTMPQVPEQRYTGTTKKIPKNSSPPTVKLEHLPPSFKAIVDKINTGDRVCVVMRGLPGSGKSFVAQQIVEETVKNAEHIVSADHFFMRNGQYKFDSSKLEQAHELARNKFAQKANLGYSPLVVDNTNMQYWEMYYYLQVANQYEYQVEILEPSTPWKFQDSKLAAKNVHGVPLASIKNMKSRYETGVSLDELMKSLGVDPVKVPKKRNIPKMIELPASLIDQFDSLRIASTADPKLGPSGSKPVMASSEVDGGLKKANEWQLRSQNNWDEMFAVPEPKPPSPDSTTAENSADSAVTPTGKNRKNKKNKGGNKSKLVPHRKDCPNENLSFLHVRELYPDVNDTYLWDLFERCQGDPNWTVGLLIDEDKADQMTSGNQLTCTCFTTEEPKQVEIKRMDDIAKQPQGTSSNAKKTKQELKQSEYIEWLDTKAAIEQSVMFASQHYPEHVNKVKDWKKPLVAVEETIFPIATASSPDIQLDPDVEDELHSLTISQELILELDEMYGGGLLKNYMKDDKNKFPPQIFVKKSVAHQLYLEILNVFFSRQEEMRLENLQKDEELAKALYEQEEKAVATQKSGKKKNAKEREFEFLKELHNGRVDEWDNRDDSSEDLLARKISKDKLLELFPDTNRDFLLDIWKSNDYDFRETVDSVKDSLFCTPDERDRLAKAQKEIFNRRWEDKQPEEPDSCTSEQNNGYTSEQLRTVEDLREEIVDHEQEKRACRIKVQEAIRSKNFEIATYYSNIAAFHKEKGDECSHEVANLMAGIHEKTQGSTKTIDLHFLNLIESQVALDRFLDKHISRLKTTKKPYVDLSIITGRGAHSIGGVPTIKNKTKKRLVERKLHCKDLNPGYLGVRVYQESPLSEDVRKEV